MLIEIDAMKKQILCLIGIASLLAPGARANQELLARSIKDARIETARTSEQLKATLDALNTLTKQTKGDLRPAYNAFCSEISKTEEAASRTRERIKWMAGDGRQYFQNWQTTVGGIANKSLRTKSQKRFDSVKKRYDKLETLLEQAGDKFRPFLSDLGDIQKALSTDVTADGVKAIRGSVNSATWNHQFINRSVNSALKEMDKMEESLSSEVK